ncbi:MAG: helix-turn-helix domain-containing protein [Elusimicrobia bacterium]|nr:helix-turn-helix domain-containing protein [Elusimicrobiota bacterium]
MESRWLSVEEIARYLGVAEDTVYRWIRARSLPAHRVGKLWKFKTEEIDEWIRSGGAGDPLAPSKDRKQRRAA